MFTYTLVSTRCTRRQRGTCVLWVTTWLNTETDECVRQQFARSNWKIKFEKKKHENRILCVHIAVRGGGMCGSYLVAASLQCFHCNEHNGPNGHVVVSVAFSLNARNQISNWKQIKSRWCKCVINSRVYVMSRCVFNRWRLLNLHNQFRMFSVGCCLLLHPEHNVELVIFYCGFHDRTLPAFHTQTRYTRDLFIPIHHVFIQLKLYGIWQWQTTRINWHVFVCVATGEGQIMFIFIFLFLQSTVDFQIAKHIHWSLIIIIGLDWHVTTWKLAQNCRSNESNVNRWINIPASPSRKKHFAVLLPYIKLPFLLWTVRPLAVAPVRGMSASLEITFYFFYYLRIRPKARVIWWFVADARNKKGCGPISYPSTVNLNDHLSVQQPCHVRR